MSVWPPARGQFLLNQVALSNSIRRLWTDNNHWIRALAVSTLYGVGDREAILARLRQIADAFAILFAQFYGQQAADRVRENYYQYIEAISKMLEAYRDGDTAAIAQQNAALYQTADELAALYAGINRFWDKATLQIMLYELINLTEYQLMQLSAGDYAKSIAEYDAMMDQSYKIADELTYGILRQFQV